MSNVCCKEFKGWCKSFTSTEVWMSILEGILLVLFIAFLTFLVIHLIVCSEPETQDTPYINNVTDIPIDESPDYTPISTTTPPRSTRTDFYSEETLNPDIQCTWTPSAKTEASTHYYEQDRTSTVPTSYTEPHTGFEVETYDETAKLDEPEGRKPDPMYNNFSMALVKIRPLRDITFGCFLTIVSQYWTLTAASCIEAIEEIDSLDSFVMMEDYGEGTFRNTHVVADVLIHPFYRGTNKSYDLVALRSESPLIKGSGDTVKLPDLLDYFLITIGETFSILGYGGFRTLDKNDRRLREVRVYTLPRGACGAAVEGWAARHLAGGRREAGGECGAGPVCAGVGAGPGAGAGAERAAGACTYCAGAPLLAGRVLLALMADNERCGVSCEPALYVNIALVRDWIQSVLRSE